MRREFCRNFHVRGLGGGSWEQRHHYVRMVLEKLAPESKTVAFDAVHEACKGNHDECLILLLPYVETTQMGFGMLLSASMRTTLCARRSSCSIRSQSARTGHVSRCSPRAKVRHGLSVQPCGQTLQCVRCSLMQGQTWTKDHKGRSPLLWASRSGVLEIVKLLVEAGAGVGVTNNRDNISLILASDCGHTETVRYLADLPISLWKVCSQY